MYYVLVYIWNWWSCIRVLKIKRWVLGLITKVNTSSLTHDVGMNQYRVFLNTHLQAGTYISYIFSLSQTKSTRVLLSDLVRRSANWCPNTCFVTMIFFLSLLWILWQSTSMYLVLSWNTTFSAMCIAVLLSPYNLMGHSGENQSLSINL